MNKEICGFCKYSQRDSYTYDLFCNLEASPYADNYIAWDNTCRFWEGGKSINGTESEEKQSAASV